MSIVHKFVSAKADSTDATLVRASNWNATHTVGSGITSIHPFMIVTTSGPSDGGDYGPVTPNTTTGGIQEALNTGNPVIVTNGTYTMVSGSFSGIVTAGYADLTFMNATLTLPNGYSGIAIVVGDGSSYMHIRGDATINEAGTPARRWIGMQVKSSNRSGLIFSTFEGLQINNAKWGIYIRIDSASGFVNSNYFSKFILNSNTVMVKFDISGYAADGNRFDYIVGEVGTNSTDGFIIAGRGTTLIDCWPYDFQSLSGQSTGSTLPEAFGTNIIGGSLTNSLWVDSGTYTSVFDTFIGAPNYGGIPVMPFLEITDSILGMASGDTRAQVTYNSSSSKGIQMGPGGSLFNDVSMYRGGSGAVYLIGNSQKISQFAILGGTSGASGTVTTDFILAPFTGNSGEFLDIKATQGTSFNIIVSAGNSGGSLRPLVFGTAAAEAFRMQIASPFFKFNEGNTGGGSAALGANSPAVTNTAPYTWIKVASADGSTVYIPAWK